MGKKHTFCCKNDETFEKHLGLEKDAAPLLSRWLSSAQRRSTAQKKIRVAAAQGFKIFPDSWVEMDQNGAKAPMITSFRMSHGKSMFNHGLRQPHFTSTWPVYLWHNCFPPLKLAGSMRLPFQSHWKQSSAVCHTLLLRDEGNSENPFRTPRENGEEHGNPNISEFHDLSCWKA